MQEGGRDREAEGWAACDAACALGWRLPAAVCTAGSKAAGQRGSELGARRTAGNEAVVLGAPGAGTPHELSTQVSGARLQRETDDVSALAVRGRHQGLDKGGNGRWRRSWGGCLCYMRIQMLAVQQHEGARAAGTRHGPAACSPQPAHLESEALLGAAQQQRPLPCNAVVIKTAAVETLRGWCSGREMEGQKRHVRR